MDLLEMKKIVKNKKKILNETFINLLEFKCLFEKIDDIEINDCIVLPLYIKENQYYELYQYEFLFQKDTESFEKYILKKTGAKKIENINKDILNLRKICFENNKKIVKTKILKWFDFILNNKLLRDEIEHIFGEFILSNIYIEIY